MIQIHNQDDPEICLEGCEFLNQYLSNDEDSANVRWCDNCHLWLHEHCAGQSIAKVDISPSSNQSYLRLDSMDMERKKSMPADVQRILGLPISRVSKKAPEDGHHGTYWYPFSMELVVVMARKWYLEGKVPENWK